MRSRIRLSPYYAWMSVLTVGFYALPSWHLVLWAALALSSAAAIVTGVVVHRPDHVAPWVLLAVTVTVFAAGDTTYNVLTKVLGQDNPFPSLADVFYLVMYPLGAGALVLLVRYRTQGRDRGSSLDAISLTVALALLSWIFLIDPYFRAPDVDWLERATSIAYPLGDILLLATVARLFITSRRNRAAQFLSAGSVGLLVSDVLYGFGQLNGTWQIGSALDLGWVVFYIAWGAAALDPSMVRLTRPVNQSAGELSLRRVALLMAVSLIAPATLLVDSMGGQSRHAPMIAVSSGLFFLLVLLRVSGVVADYGQAVKRERVLRSVAVDLGKAADRAGAAAVVGSAVAQLVRPDRAQRTVLLEQLPDAPGDDRTTGPSTASRLVETHALDGPVADAARGFPAALVCPLVLDGLPPDDPRQGCLVVAAEESALVDLRGTLEVLASQVALALERLALAQEISRRDSEAYFRTLVHNAHDVILIVDGDGRIRYASPSASTVLGPSPVEGRHYLALVDPADREQVRRALAAPQQDERAVAVMEAHRIERADGSCIEVQVTLRDLRTDPTVGGIVLTLRDVTEQRRLQRELAHRAFHDPLTGLANRLLFAESVDRALAGVRVRGGVVGVLLIDLDDFKLVNDTMGHETGDDLLVAVATRLTDVLDEADVAARLGGDEFAVLVTSAARAVDIDAVAERVVTALGAPLEVADGLAISVSVGVASTPEAHGSVEMLRHADLAMYAAKEAGKGQWRRYRQSLHLAAVDRFQVRSELQRALDVGDLDLHYQPILDLRGGQVVGVEALVRWHHPRRGTVAPGEFIAAAEETGLIVPLGRWVLERALADLARFQSTTPGLGLTMSVNVSAREIREPGFVDRVVDALARWRIPGERLVVEITETGLLADDAHVLSGLEALRRRGVRIALDDFGTGYSSLDYVRQHAVDILKIDKTFTDGIDRSHRHAALVRAIVGLARSLALSVVAEGVETHAQLDALLEAGCELGQGFLFSTAVTADRVTQFLTADELGRHWAATSGAGAVELRMHPG